MLTLHSDEYGPVAVIHCIGSLTRETLKDLEEAWKNLVSIKPDVIALDFRELVQIDSIAINHIFKLSRAALEKNIKFVIYDVNEALMQIFEVIKLDKAIDILKKKKFESTYGIPRRHGA